MWENETVLKQRLPNNGQKPGQDAECAKPKGYPPDILRIPSGCLPERRAILWPAPRYLRQICSVAQKRPDQAGPSPKPEGRRPKEGRTPESELRRPESTAVATEWQ